MNITTETHIKETYTTHLGFGINTRFKNIEPELSETMTNKLLKYAINRLDNDLKELIINKGYKVVICRTINSRCENLCDSDYQVNFISKSGLMISVDYILLNSKNNPFLDHGISIAEGQ